MKIKIKNTPAIRKSKTCLSDRKQCLQRNHAQNALENKLKLVTKRA